MHKVQVIHNGKNTILTAKSGEKLSSLLISAGFFVDHICGGKGLCKKCTVDINGQSQLSCQYCINQDVVVTLPEFADVSNNHTKGKIADKMCLVLDLGTTTIELALVDTENANIIDSIKKINPQRTFGADVISRIDYCCKNGVTNLNKTIIDTINSMIAEMVNKYRWPKVDTLFVAGNTTMLHLFFGVDCSSMGVSPYTPTFLDSKNISASGVGIDFVEKIISLPNISAFVGADIVAGLNFAGMPGENKYNLLVDMGTNAEIVLYNQNNVLCTAAAAGPCFEGANISCGMSAVDGAIYAFDEKNYSTINNKKPVGICATGLIDIIANLVKNQVIDDTGFMECSVFEIADNVHITQKDIRNFQLAKSAVYSAISTLMDVQQISFDDIETVFVSGGFSEKMNMQNAISVGLLPKELWGKCVAINNSCLMGTVKYASGKNDTVQYVNNAEYVDLSANKMFVDLFIDNMMF